ncbi:alpha/beta hydrolase [Actinoallomurus sp. NBC_01490]|uniref:alpha/beta fold hydrolase n=1 Tax=Actinoallomurus sp. NBC_01490 TaxID=2903557 RepID=UPI002E332156|nr:alpha/beta hydrolase [Actinoallomurus sp. NBC_01490]
MSFTDIASALAEQGRSLLPIPGHPVAGTEPDHPPPTRSMTVTADDGVELHAEIQDAPGAPLTVVFCHGYLLNCTSWDVQRTMLAGKARVVLWDHRGHGRSGWGTPPNATIDQVGRDLFAVIRAAAPRGRLVLVGHSMGGMAILALAKSHPGMFGGRVVGVVLSSTSAGGLSTITAGLPSITAPFVVRRLVPATLSRLRRHARLVDGARRSAGGATYLITWPYLYGSRVPRPVARLTTRLMASVPIQVIAEFYTELVRYDLHAVLPALGRIPVLVLVGERDVITPLAHAEALVAAMSGGELVVVPDSGHLLVLERPREFGEQVWRLISRVTPPKLVAAASVPGERIAKPARAQHHHRS